MSYWVQGLNPEQVRAVQHSVGPLLILAGAGSGKTTVLVSRTGRLIDEGKIPPRHIAVLTFTNKAARELKNRVAKKLGDQAKGLWAGTFHSFGLQILRKNYSKAGLTANFGVIDQSDCNSILKELLRDLTVGGKDKFDIDKILNIINDRRSSKEKLQAFDEYHEVAEVLLPKFVRKLDLLGVVDFEGLLLKPLQLFQEHPDVLEGVQNQLQYLMVDEFQDTNEVQMRLIDQIVKRHRNLAVVGDDDQSIYGWRGAQVSNILNFPKVYKPCEVIRLERNYRSSSAILNVANELIKKNRHRHGKVLKPEGKTAIDQLPEVFTMENEEEEAEFIVREIRAQKQSGKKFSDIAVLYRSNSQGGMLEAYLRQNQIPYTVSGGTAFFDRKEIKDILAYMRVSLAPHDVALRRVLNVPARGIGDNSVEKILDYSQKNKLPFIAACKAWREIQIPEKTGQAIDAFFSYLQGFKESIFKVPAADALLKTLEEIHFKSYLVSLSSDPAVGEKRWATVEIFARVWQRFVEKGGANISTLKEFLDTMELRFEGEDEEEKEQVSLMTLHACKGLEFPVVFIIGVEEDLLPHKTLGSDVDEERRLFYVGLTRAEEKLVLTHCKVRKRHGVNKPVTASRFLLEIPTNLVLKHETAYRPVTPEQREALLRQFLSR